MRGSVAAAGSRPRLRGTVWPGEGAQAAVGEPNRIPPTPTVGDRGAGRP
jgi:hypothetical protein